MHPVILAGIADSLERLRRTDEIVVIDAALLIEVGVTDLLDALVVVAASADVRKKRLVGRGMLPDDVEARIAAQAPQEQLIEKADIVVRNDGTLDDLVAEADRVWNELEERKRG